MRSRKVQHACRAWRKCAFQVGTGSADLDHAGAGLTSRLVVPVALTPVDDHLRWWTGNSREAVDCLRIVAGDTTGDGNGHACRATGGAVAGLVAGQLRNPLTSPTLQLHQIDE